jgi:hypothetical protein
MLFSGELLPSCPGRGLATARVDRGERWFDTGTANNIGIPEDVDTADGCEIVAFAGFRPF